MKPKTKKMKPKKNKTNKKNRNKTRRTNQRCGGAMLQPKPTPKEICDFVKPFMVSYSKQKMYPAITGGLALFLYGEEVKNLYKSEYGSDAPVIKDLEQNISHTPSDGDIVLFFQSLAPSTAPPDTDTDTGFKQFEEINRHPETTPVPWTVEGAKSKNGTTFYGENGVSVDVIRNFDGEAVEKDIEYEKKTCVITYKGFPFRVLILDLVKLSYIRLNDRNDRRKLEIIDNIKYYIKYYIGVFKTQLPESLSQFLDEFIPYVSPMSPKRSAEGSPERFEEQMGFSPQPPSSPRFDSYNPYNSQPPSPNLLSRFDSPPPSPRFDSPPSPNKKGSKRSRQNYKVQVS